MTGRVRTPLFVWEALSPDGEWYTIGAVLPGLGASTLVMRSRERAMEVEYLARAHGEGMDEEVRLATYQYTGVVEVES